MILTAAQGAALKQLEERLVELGVAAFGEPIPDMDALVAAGWATSPQPGVYVLTPAGWRTVHALREHLAANREAAIVTGTMPPFSEPEAPDMRAARIAMARDIFARRMGAGAADADTAADAALLAAQRYAAKERLG